MSDWNRNATTNSKRRGIDRKRPTTAPIFAAYCQIAKKLRIFNRKNSSFVACFVLPDPSLREIFRHAAEEFTGSLRRRSDRTVETYVKVIATEKDASSALSILAQPDNRQQIILLLENDTFLRDEFEYSADVVSRLDRFRRTHMLAAGKLVHGYRFSDEEMMMMLSRPAEIFAAAFRHGRPVSAALRKLQQVEVARSPRRVEPAAKENDNDNVATLDGLHGLGPAAEWGHELAKDIADWRAGTIEWDRIDRGILLSGPPGCGKTLFAGALARTCKMPLVVGSAAKWQKVGALDSMLRAMTDCFNQARARSPAILFIDEIDAFGDRLRSSTQHADYTRQVISGLLECLDGFDRREGVVVVGACNYPHLLDPAIVRPGRLDRHITIPLPDDDGRLGILKQYTSLEPTGDDRRDFLLQSRGCTGADIEQTARSANRVARKSRRDLTIQDVLDQLPSLITFPKDIIHANAVHEIGHAMISILIGHGEVRAVQISPQGIANGQREAIGGALLRFPAVQRRTRQYYLDHIAMLMGGIAAEKIVFGEFDDGASLGEGSDLVEATRYATLVECAHGMGSTLLVESGHNPGRLLNNPEIRIAVEKLLSTELERAKRLLSEYRKVLEDLSDDLAKTHHLDGAVIVDALAEGKPGSLSVS
jgi:cell division protease FtsH